MIYFSGLYKEEQKLKKNSFYFDFFYESIELILNKKTEISSLQKNYFVVKLAHAYTHFGFLLFSNISLEFMVDGFFEEAGIDKNISSEIFFLLKSILAEESGFNSNDKIISEENLNNEFCDEILKRVVCSSEKENFNFALDVFSHKEIFKIRSFFDLFFDKTHLKLIVEEQELFSKIGNNFFPFENLTKSAKKIFLLLKNAPFLALVLRLACYHFNPQHANQKLFFIRHISEENFVKLEKLSFILVSFTLVGYASKDGLIFYKELCIAEMRELINETVKKKERTSHIFYSCKNLEFYLTDLNEYEELLNFGIELGVVYRTPGVRNNPFFALTEKGMHIMRPLTSVS